MPSSNTQKSTLVDEIPILRAFFHNKSILEGVDKAGVDLFGMAGMIVGMKLNLPSVFGPMEMQTNETDNLKNEGEMLADMTIKMYGGQKGAEFVYKVLVRPHLRCTARELSQSFSEERYGMTLLGGIPIVGKFITASQKEDANWKNIIGRGLLNNSMEIGMAVTGAAAMQGAGFALGMLGGISAPVTMAVEIGAMTVGMTLPMVVPSAVKTVAHSLSR